MYENPDSSTLLFLPHQLRYLVSSASYKHILAAVKKYLLRIGSRMLEEGGGGDSWLVNRDSQCAIVFSCFGTPSSRFVTNIFNCLFFF